MQINVGTQLTMAGGKWYCHMIKRDTRTCLATAADVHEHSNMKCVDSNNIRYLSQQSCTFEVDEVITISYEVIFLRRLDGAGHMNLFSYYNLTKESKPDGFTGADSSGRETTDSTPETGGEGSEVGSSAGGQSASEADYPLY